MPYLKAFKIPFEKRLYVAATFSKSKEYPIISKNILKALYETEKTLKIISDEYTLTIKGTDIVNYQNEFNTEINFEKEDGKLTFSINEGNNLPGLVSLKLTEASYKYLYLYNEAKDKYQQLKAKDLENINLDVTGKYLLTKDKINTVSISVIVIILVVVIILGLVIAYIAVKKQYWIFNRHIIWGVECKSYLSAFYRNKVSIIRWCITVIYEYINCSSITYFNFVY